jgi:pilus assembly protein Flp/PilA
VPLGKPFSYGNLESLDGELPFLSIGTARGVVKLGGTVIKTIRQLWAEESGQDVAEYAVMLAVILVIVIGTVRLIGSNANTVFSQVGSQLGQ